MANKTTIYKSKQSMPMTDMVLWLKADAGITLNGSTVSAWADQSGAGNHCSQSTASYQPTFNAADSGANNKPTLSFDGSNDRLNSSIAINGINTSSFSMFIVAKNGASSGTYKFQFAINNISVQNCKYPDGQYYYYSGADFLSNNTSDCSNSGTPYRIYEMIKNYNVSLKMYINSVLRNTATSGGLIGSFTNGVFVVGAYNISGSQSWLGNIAEIIIYKTLLTDADRAVVENYLITKYSIS